MNCSCDIVPDNWGGSDKDHENFRAEAKDGSKLFSNLGVAVHICSNEGPFRSCHPSYPPPGLQHLHLVGSSKIETGKISGTRTTFHFPYIRCLLQFHLIFGFLNFVAFSLSNVVIV